MGTPTLSLIIILLFYSLILAVRSDQSVIRLPTDLCPAVSGPSTCPVKCFRTDAVCGADGVTYWCGCPEATCAGTRVVKRGYCHVDNGGGSGGQQAFLLVHILWLLFLAFSLCFGLL